MNFTPGSKGDYAHIKTLIQYIIKMPTKFEYLFESNNNKSLINQSCLPA